jgi:hypothetical protein
MLHTRCDAALRDVRADFERTLAVLREENSTLRRMLEAASRRADDLSVALAKSVVVQATPLPAPPSIPRKRTSAEAIQGLGNLLDPVPFGDTTGLFDNARAASLMAAEDDDGAAATAAA